MAGGMNGSRTHLVLREEDVVKLACEFMENREITIAQIALERESGVINGNYSDDVLFLRQLILDGQWEDTLEFIQPLAQLPTFDHTAFQFNILKHKYLELLCIKSEVPLSATDVAVDEVVKLLKDLEPLCPTKEEYSSLCLLLTLPKLTDSSDYRSWNPVKARLNCFKQILPLVQDLLSGEKRESQSSPLVATNDRLLQLIIKGILYESCVDYCQQKATQSRSSNSIEFTTVLSQSDFNDSDLSLLSWLQSIPSDTFSCPFEQKSLNVDVERLQKPQLETSWTEHILVTPIRSNMFPHSAMPAGAKDVMTKSLSLLLKSDVAGGLGSQAGQQSLYHQHGQQPGGPAHMADMSRSLASFHLTGKKLMDTSVDQLFKDRKKEESALQNFNHQDISTPVEESRASAERKLSTTDTQKPKLEETGESRRGSQLALASPSAVMGRPKFIKVTTLEDVQAVRCAEFHPDGRLYAVGSNSKTLRICEYPSDMAGVAESHETGQPTVLFKRTKHHKGSIYCLAWSPNGSLIATGSNDKTVKLMKFNGETCALDGSEKELTMHDGTVRDCCFVQEGGSNTSLLLTGGAGDCKVYVTDCETWTPFQALTGHTDHILSLYSWGDGPIFASGSMDKTVRFWDLRSRGCVNLVQCGPSPVTACCVDPSGRLLVTGHEDSTCILYDIRGSRPVQTLKVHTSEVRSVRFSPSAYYLLTGSYDGTLVLSDLQGDLTCPLPSVTVAKHQDKVITGRWHPQQFSFLSTSADKTSTLWTLPTA